MLTGNVIPVPRALPLNADLPEEEAEAERILAEAASLAKERGIQKVAIRSVYGVGYTLETT